MSKKLTVKGLKISTCLLFVLYLLILINVIILKDGTALYMARHGVGMSLSDKIEGVNFIPFVKTIIPYLGGNHNIRIAMENLLGNIFAFSPLGFFLPLLFKKCKRFKSVLIISVGTSLGIEIIQVVFYLGIGDIDDLILNVLGSIIGFGGITCLNLILKKQNGFLNHKIM